MLSKDVEESFISWLVTQKNARGTYYLERVARRYAYYLRVGPNKLKISLSANDRNVFNCKTAESFNRLLSIFVSAPNYDEVNHNGHHTFSAGLSAYRRFIDYTEGNNGVDSLNLPQNQTMTAKEKMTYANKKTLYVDFTHPELCSGCDPLTCIVEGKVFNVGNWRDILVSLTEDFIKSKPQTAQLYHVSLYSRGESVFFLKEKPKLATRQLTNGYWINVNLSIKDLVLTIGKLCEFCGVDLNDVCITYTHKQDTKRSNSEKEIQSNFEHGGTEIIHNISSLSTEKSSVPDEVVETLRDKYVSGFRFETTYVNLLSSTSGIDVNAQMVLALKQMMFHRKDDIYFLLDGVSDGTTRSNIINSANCFLKKYNCFEICELYDLYKDELSINCIRNVEDFEAYFEQICTESIRCIRVPGMGNRIVRYSNNSVDRIFGELSAKIVSFISEEHFGSCNEEDLHIEFNAFSINLLTKIIRQYAADKLIRVEINDFICFQTFYALGLPENFSEILAEALDKLCSVGLEPTLEALHTVLSIDLGVNFKEEYNLLDWDTYRRLIAAMYHSQPLREWKNNIFGEVYD